MSYEERTDAALAAILAVANRNLPDHPRSCNYYNVRIYLETPRGQRCTVVFPALCRTLLEAADAFTNYQPYPGWSKITYKLVGPRPKKELA